MRSRTTTVTQREGDSDAGGVEATGPSASANTNGNGVTKEILFNVLSNKRRRFTVHLLKHNDGMIELGELATQIAAWEHDVEPVEVTGTQRKRVYTALQQSHLPTMDDAGIIEFDKDRGTVEPRTGLRDVELYLDVVEGRDIPWSTYYLGLAAIGAGVIGGAWAGVWPFVALPDIAWGVFVVTALLISACAHWLYMRNRRLGVGSDPPEVQ